MALINRWMLTENANDCVSGLNLTNNGAVTFSRDNGASFNGTNQWLSGTKTLSTSFSLAVWVRTNNLSRQAPMLITSSAGNYYTGIDMGCYTNESNFWVGMANGTDSARGIGDFTTTNYPSSQFIFMTGTYSSNSLFFYRNAIQIASRIATPSTIYTDLSLGRAGAYNGEYLNGNIFDARIYDHALSYDEVRKLYIAGPNGGVASCQ